jgi:hypothetical protein
LSSQDILSFKIESEKSEISEKNDNMVEIISIKKCYSDASLFTPDLASLGQKISVKVLSIGTENDEYLVNFTYLISEMKKNGFECVHTRTFEEYYNMENIKIPVLKNEEQKASFLNRSFVFKKISNITPSSFQVQKIKISKKPKRTQ